MKKTKRLNIRLTEEEFNRLQGFAQQHNLTITNYVKLCTGVMGINNIPEDAVETEFGAITNLDILITADAIMKAEWEEERKAEIEEAEEWLGKNKENNIFYPYGEIEEEEAEATEETIEKNILELPRSAYLEALRKCEKNEEDYKSDFDFSSLFL